MPRKATVLYVEDNEDDLLLFKTTARRRCAHFDVEGVSNIKLAKKYLRGEDRYSDRSRHPFPASVVSDYALPGGTGQDLLRWIRSQPNLLRLVVIMLTSSTKPERIQHCYELGLDHFLVKPSGIQRLSMLLECLDHCLKATPPCYDALRSLPEYRAPAEAPSAGLH